MTTTKFGFEVRGDDGRWDVDGAGIQDDSNTFDTREEAEREIPALAAALGVEEDNVRVRAL